MISIHSSLAVWGVTRIGFYPEARKKVMFMRHWNLKLFILAVAALASGLALSGCKSTAGVAGLSVSGQVLTGGKVIDAGVTVGSNNVTVSGLFSQGTNTIGGTVAVPVGN